MFPCEIYHFVPKYDYRNGASKILMVQGMLQSVSIIEESRNIINMKVNFELNRSKA